MPSIPEAMTSKCTTVTPSSLDDGPESSLRDNRKLRILRLYRPPNGTYGFHLKGGRENGTGFFISHVESGTEAFAQGLRTGDQLLRVNDCDVSGALHKEVAALVRSGCSVVLHVRSAGSISTHRKLCSTTSLSVTQNTKDVGVAPSAYWRSRSSQLSQELSGVERENSKISTNSDLKCVRITINGAGTTVIGCSICKGPRERPGIFVQRVTEGGIAHKGGLRAGDQIIACNGISFGIDQDFQKAIQVMKSNSTMQLEVLQGAGSDMAAGESSGYNSSASSETSDDRCSLFEAEAKAAFPKSVPLAPVRMKKLSGQFQIDNNRDWEEIDAEWADAEITLKRLVLNHNRTKISQKSDSMVNICKVEPVKPKHHDIDSSQIYATCSSCCQLVPLGSVVSEMPLTKHRSMLDLRHNSSEFAHHHPRKHRKNKPGLSHDNEQSALRRLERLSSAPVQVSSALANHCKTNSISSTSSEDSLCYKSHRGSSSKCSSERPCSNRSPEYSPPNRYYNVNGDSNEFSSEDTDSLFSSQSSTVLISDATSGRFTSKIEIRSSPPLPPPRGNTTKLTKLHREYNCRHPSRTINQNSSVDGDRIRWQNDNVYSSRIDDFDHWKESNGSTISATKNLYSSSIPPPPPPLPSEHLGKAIIPPPPPPMPNVTSNHSNSSSNHSGTNRLKEITGAVSKLRTLEDRDTNHWKVQPTDPKKAQHEQLMEEFKKAHAQMISRRKSTELPEETDSSTA